MTFRAIDIGARPVRARPQGVVPELRWLPIARLVVDEDYQRPLTPASWNQIQKIAAGFDWAHFLPVLVAPREGGFWSVIDGQHRTHAAKMVGLTEVPASIVDLDEVGQARAFAAVNGQTTAVHAGHIFRAGLRAGEAWALATEAAVAKAGVRLVDYRPSSTARVPGAVDCVGFVRDQVKAGRGALLTMALDAIRRSRAHDEIEVWSHTFLRPFINALIDVPRAQRRDLAQFLDTWPPAEMMRQAALLKSQSADPAVFRRTAGSLLTEIMALRMRKWLQGEGGA